jgi:putative transposase
MKTLSGTYPRFGSPRIRIFLQRDGISLGKERCGRCGRKQACKCHASAVESVLVRLLRPLAPTARNSVWSYDFVYDACANGQKIKCLTVVDDYTRECLAIDVNGAIRSSRVIEVLCQPGNSFIEKKNFWNNFFS